MIQKPAPYLTAASAWGPTTIITDILFILGASKTHCLSGTKFNSTEWVLPFNYGKRAQVVIQTRNYTTTSSL